MKKLIFIVACLLLTPAVQAQHEQEATAQTTATGTITGTWVNPPTGSSTSPGTKMQLSTDGGTTWVDSCTGTGTATTCKSTAVPLGVIYRVRFIRLALDPQFNSDPSPVSIVSAIKEPGPTGTTAIITIN